MLSAFNQGRKGIESIKKATFYIKSSFFELGLLLSGAGGFSAMAGNRPLTDSELDLLYETLDELSGRHALRDRALAELLFSSGARVSELLSRRVGDLRTVDGSIRKRFYFRRGERKDRKPHVCVVSNRAQRALADYLATRVDAGAKEPLFLSQKGGGLKRQWAWKLLRRIYRTAGLDLHRLATHAGRKTVARRVVEQTGSIRAAQVVLGHSTSATTERYLDLEQDEALDAWERIVNG